LSGTTFNAVVVKAGTPTAVAVASWSRVAAAPFTLDTNYHSFEIRWTANSVIFLVDNVVRHIVSGTTTPITTTLNFPMTVHSVNSSGATNRLIAVRNCGIGRFGEPETTQVNMRRPVLYCYNIPSQVHVNSASTVHWDIFNADAALIVRVLSIKQLPNVTTAVTGIVFDWLLERTTAVGTGGSAQTAWLADTSDTSLDADVTCRSKPTGGATQSTDLFNYSISSEETNAATIQLASQGGLELVPEPLRQDSGGKGIVLRANQGIRCVQVTNSAQGNTGWLIAFTVE
jgi:hypothetical protein